MSRIDISKGIRDDHGAAPASCASMRDVKVRRRQAIRALYGIAFGMRQAYYDIVIALPESKPMSSRRKFLEQTGAGLGLAVAGALPGALAYDGGEDPEAPEIGTPPPAADTLPSSLSPVTNSFDDVLLWDGSSGMTGIYFNRGVKVPWRNRMGDWLDVNGTPQGPVAYASLRAAVGTMRFPVTELARKWYEERNTGALLRASGVGADIWRRGAADPADRPRLTLTLSTGLTVTAPCTASPCTSLNTSFGIVNTRQSFGNQVWLALQFGLPELPDNVTIASATIEIVCERVYTGGAGFAVFELNPPKVGVSGIPQAGLAMAFPRDASIETHPDVYFATTLTDPGERAEDFPEWSLAGPSRVEIDPDLGVPALHANYVVGNLTGMTCNHRWSRRSSAPKRNVHNGLQLYEEVAQSQYLAQQHPGTPAELYLRYYLKLKDGYQCSVDGKKLPGLAGRYGRWLNISYTVIDGNGGGPTKGTWNGSYFSGWSMRGLAQMAPADANPYRDEVVPETYAYHAAMAGPFGDHWRWGSHDAGFPLYEPDRWYCIEQRVKLNTIAGPFDSNGNGVGNADGILEIWVDGIKVLSRSNVVFRKHPAIKIDEVWLDHYHGGTNPPEEPHAFAMTGVVVARRYIGPMNTGTSAPPTSPPPSTGGGDPHPGTSGPLVGGALNTIATTNSFAAVNSGIAGIAYAWHKIVDDYSGGVFNPHFSAAGAMIVHGGGHAATYDNSVVALDFADRTWKRIGEPSQPVSWTASNPDPKFDTATCEYADGVPGAAHTYDALAILPPDAGGGARGSLVRPASFAVHPAVSANTGQAHAFDFATGRWRRFTTNRIGAGYPGAACCYDSTRKRIWWHSSFSSKRGVMTYVDTQARVQVGVKIRSTSAVLGIGGGPDSGFMEYDASRDIVIASWNSSGRTFNLFWARPSDPGGGWRRVTLSAPIPGRTNFTYPMAYVPQLDKWIMFAQADSAAVYELSIPTDPAQAWTVERRALPAGQVLPTHFVTGKRWAYVPALQSILWWANSRAPVLAYRPAGI